MEILAIIFSGIAAICASLSFFSLDFQKLKTKWKAFHQTRGTKKVIKKLGGVEKMKVMSIEELADQYLKKVGRKPTVGDIKRIQEMTGLNFKYENLLSREFHKTIVDRYLDKVSNILE